MKILMAFLAGERYFCCNSKLGLGKFGEPTQLVGLVSMAVYIFTENNRFSHSAASFIHMTSITVTDMRD